MKHHTLHKAVLLFILLCSIPCLLLCSCDSDSLPENPFDQTEISTEKGTRDNTAKVLIPSADGAVSYSCDTAILDASNASQGYVMVNYTDEHTAGKLQITGPDNVTYSYDLNGGYEVFPLTAGNGTYLIGVYENVNAAEETYALILSQEITVTLSDELGSYLYPNQYVNFSSDSLPVKKAVELAYPANNDLDVVSNVYNYIIEHFDYDYDKAASVQSGYLPVVDEVFRSNSGICFDYAAVMASMLRSQAIPTRLEVGYKGEEYHAWISTYIHDIGWINGIIEFDGGTWHLLDPTLASTSQSPKHFIAEDDEYITIFVY